MKLVEDRQEVLIGGAQSVDTFTIRASAKAFSILSSNLYSNPLGSMIRELSTNAYDAHVMSDKKDEPFVLTLPNSLDPSFKIRDFGPGLSSKEIMSVYTTFFESTKTDSNDVVGCLGLGSKSPFGVADSFTVTSFYGGKKTIYSAFLNDARIPSIAKFAELDTDEESGIEIEVGIKEDDFRRFSREVNSQLKYFKVKPIIQGKSDFEWDVEEEYLYEGTGWKMVKNGNGPRVIQGQIQYPINVNDMGKAFDNAPAEVQAILNRTVLFEVAIGDVNIAPSREALSYDDRTSENIIKYATKILEELPPQIKKAVEHAETEYEAKLMYSEVMSNLGRGYGYHRGSSLSNYMSDSGEVTWKGKDVSKLAIEIEKDEIQSATSFTKNYNNRYQKSVLYASDRNHDGNKTWDFTARDLSCTMWVYVEEGDKAVEARAKQYAQEHFGRDLAMFIIKVAPGMTSQKLANRLGLKKKHLIIAADLPKVKRVGVGKNTTTGKKEFRVQRFDGNYTYNKADQWTDEIVEDDLLGLKGYYVNLDRYDVLDQNNRTVSNLREYIAAMKELGMLEKTDKVYGLRKANQKRAHNLIDLFRYIEDKIGSITLNKKYTFDGPDHTMKVVDKLESSNSSIKEIHSKIHDGPMKKVLGAMIANNETRHSGNVKIFLNKFGHNAKGVVIDMSEEAKQLDELYPMIGCTSYYLNVDLVVDYITQMDTLRSLIATTEPQDVVVEESLESV